MKLLTALALALAMAGGCAQGRADDSVSVGEEQNNTAVAVDKGTTIAVSLDTDPRTRYRWQTAELDRRILRESGHLRFTAVGGGTTTLRLAYRQPWDNAAPPYRTFALQVSVR